MESFSALSILSRTKSGIPSLFDKNFILTPFSINSSNSLSIVSLKRFIRNITSSFGLFQFSVEKEKRESVFIPISCENLTVLFTAFTPSLWPKTLGRPRFVAHLPFPSIIIATCSGNLYFSFNYCSLRTLFYTYSAVYTPI